LSRLQAQAKSLEVESSLLLNKQTTWLDLAQNRLGSDSSRLKPESLATLIAGTAERNYTPAHLLGSMFSLSRCVLSLKSSVMSHGGIGHQVGFSS
jgi:hypothetical protein